MLVIDDELLDRVFFLRGKGVMLIAVWVEHIDHEAASELRCTVENGDGFETVYINELSTEETKVETVLRSIDGGEIAPTGEDDSLHTPHGDKG